MTLGVLLVFLDGHLITDSLRRIEVISMAEEQLASFW